MRLLREGKEIPPELEAKLEGKKSPKKPPPSEGQPEGSKKDNSEVQQLTEKVTLYTKCKQLYTDDSLDRGKRFLYW